MIKAHMVRNQIDTNKVIKSNEVPKMNQEEKPHSLDCVWASLFRIHVEVALVIA